VLLQDDTTLLRQRDDQYLLRDWEISAHSQRYPELAPCYFSSFIVKEHTEKLYVNNVQSNGPGALRY
jgi:hypothetical protein